MLIGVDGGEVNCKEESTVSLKTKVVEEDEFEA